MLTSIRAILFEFLLNTGQGVIRLSRIQPRHGTPNPLQKLEFDVNTSLSYLQSLLGTTYVACQAFVFLHQTLVFLVHFEDFANSVSCCFGLKKSQVVVISMVCFSKVCTCRHRKITCYKFNWFENFKVITQDIRDSAIRH